MSNSDEDIDYPDESSSIHSLLRSEPAIETRARSIARISQEAINNASPALAINLSTSSNAFGTPPVPQVGIPVTTNTICEMSDSQPEDVILAFTSCSLIKFTVFRDKMKLKLLLRSFLVVRRITKHKFPGLFFRICFMSVVVGWRNAKLNFVIPMSTSIVVGVRHISHFNSYYDQIQY